jgi:hypothetical protein
MKYPDCPKRWFGPDDYEDGDDVKAETHKRDYEIAIWKFKFDNLPWYKKLYIFLCTTTKMPD